MLLALSATLLAGCNFITKNNWREANQIIATVRADGVTLTVTQNEFTDYVSQNAGSLVQNYGLETKEVLEILLENKLQSKYLIIKSMTALRGANPLFVFSDRASAGLVGGAGSFNTPQSVLTWAEYYSAIKTINDQIEESAKGYEKEVNDEKTRKVIRDADKTNLEKIEIVENGALRKEYNKDEKIDIDRIRILLTYDLKAGESKAQTLELPITENMITTAFDSSSEGKKTLEITLDEQVYTDGVMTLEPLVASWDYEVMAPRTTKTKNEMIWKDELENRYMTKTAYEAFLQTKPDYKAQDYAILDLNVLMENAKSAGNPARADAYRRLLANLTNLYRDMDYFYKSAFESAVMKAIQFELKREAIGLEVKDGNVPGTFLEGPTNPNAPVELFKQKIDTEYEFFLRRERDKANVASKVPKDVTDAFNTAISSNIDALYYVPAGVKNVGEFVYVNQILVKFTEEQKAYFTDYGSGTVASNMDLYNRLINAQGMETRESNPDYDVTYECPLHGKHEADADCKWLTDEKYDAQKLCPSIAYVTNGWKRYVAGDPIPAGDNISGHKGEWTAGDWYYDNDVKDADDKNISDLAKKVNVATIWADLITAISGIDKALAPDDALKARIEIFEGFKYRFNEDEGIMNNQTGYLIPPTGVSSSFYDSFVQCGRELVATWDYDFDTIGAAPVGTKDKKGVVNTYFQMPGNNYQGFSQYVAYCFTDYGIHILMINLRPFAKIANDPSAVKIDPNGKPATGTLGTPGYRPADTLTLGSDLGGSRFTVDANGKETDVLDGIAGASIVLNIDQKTYASNILQTLIKEKADNSYTEWARTIIVYDAKNNKISEDKNIVSLESKKIKEIFKNFGVK